MSGSLVQRFLGNSLSGKGSADFLRHSGIPPYFLMLARGLRNGLYYGVKIRLPHALVMTVLFSSKTGVREIIVATAKKAFEHGFNLGKFVLIYKAIIGLSMKGAAAAPATGSGGLGLVGRPSHPLHAMLAGAVGAYVAVAAHANITHPMPLTATDGRYFTWSNYSSVNYQILLYLVSRVLIALVKLWSKKELDPYTKKIQFKQAYPYLACVTWALVMWLFEYHPELLHPSLTASMEELYHDSNVWKRLQDFLPSPATLAVYLSLLTLA